MDLFNTDLLPSLLKEGAMDPKILKHYVLIHDNEEGPADKANEILLEMKGTSKFKQFVAETCPNSAKHPYHVSAGNTARTIKNTQGYLPSFAVRKHEIVTSGSGSGVAANSYFKKHEDSGCSFTFRGGTEDKLASKNNSKNNVNVARGCSVSGWPGAVNVESTVDDANHARNLNDSLVDNEQRASKPSEMNSGSVDAHLYNIEDAARKAFVFTTSSKPKSSVRSRHKQDLRSGRCDNSSSLKQAAGT